jgi:predicted SnoaL-like aldol condensation-catalyzing enzyme
MRRMGPRASAIHRFLKKFELEERDQTPFVDGDYVILHVHAVREPGTRGNAIIDVFARERQDRRALRAVDPRKPANSNGMF